MVHLRQPFKAAPSTLLADAAGFLVQCQRVWLQKSVARDLTSHEGA